MVETRAAVVRKSAPIPRIVMAVLVTAIHVFLRKRKSWMLATSASMTNQLGPTRKAALI